MSVKHFCPNCDREEYEFNIYGQMYECYCGWEGRLTNLKVRIRILPNEVLEYLHALNDDERLSLFRNFCTRCGSRDPRCQCWNDD